MDASQIYWEDLKKVADKLFEKGIVEHSNFHQRLNSWSFGETTEGLAKSLNEIFEEVGLFRAAQFCELGNVFHGGYKMGKCRMKHTEFQIDNEHWKCPSCGAGQESFYIISSINDDCPLIHPDDEVICDHCKLSMYGEEVVKLIMKKEDLVPCPFCDGKGLVHKDKVQ